MLCINTKHIPGNVRNPKALALLKEGEPYTVADQRESNFSPGKWVFTFIEAPHPEWPMIGYSQDRFIPLQSDTAPEIEIEQPQPAHA